MPSSLPVNKSFQDTPQNQIFVLNVTPYLGSLETYFLLSLPTVLLFTISVLFILCLREVQVERENNPNKTPKSVFASYGKGVVAVLPYKKLYIFCSVASRYFIIVDIRYFYPTLSNRWKKPKYCSLYLLNYKHSNFQKLFQIKFFLFSLLENFF